MKLLQREKNYIYSNFQKAYNNFTAYFAESEYNGSHVKTSGDVQSLTCSPFDAFISLLSVGHDSLVVLNGPLLFTSGTLVPPIWLGDHSLANVTATISEYPIISLGSYSRLTLNIGCYRADRPNRGRFIVSGGDGCIVSLSDSSYKSFDFANDVLVTGDRFYLAFRSSGWAGESTLIVLSLSGDTKIEIKGKGEAVVPEKLCGMLCFKGNAREAYELKTDLDKYVPTMPSGVLRDTVEGVLCG